MNGTLDISADGTEYTITVGSGGASQNNGLDSSFGSAVVAIGGGAARSFNQAGNNGGSGGGGGGWDNANYAGNLNTSLPQNIHTLIYDITAHLSYLFILML